MYICVHVYKFRAEQRSNNSVGNFNDCMTLLKSDDLSFLRINW